MNRAPKASLSPGRVCYVLSQPRLQTHRNVRVRMLAPVGALLFSVSPACADPLPPTLSVALRETIDAWTVPSGSDPGSDILNKVQISATVAGDRLGLAGWSAHAQIFRTDGASLSRRLGDIQTADNIEAEPVMRLFEAWVQKSFGSGDRTLALRAGLLDFNADFDSTTTASLFINSSHGIGADVARSGRGGPSIFPVSALGGRLAWSPSKALSFRLAVFDGVPGDPDHTRRFATIKLRRADGALIAGQFDWHLTDKARVEVGAWRYTVPLVDAAMEGRQFDQGGFASIEGPLPGIKGLSGWWRIGVAEGHVQPVKRYIGAGAVLEGPFAARPHDRFGLAVARATLGDTALDPATAYQSETTIEATYQLKVSDTIAVQPDVQYIISPSARADAPDAVAIGVRLVLTAGYPRKAPATEATDPTVPPDGPQPPDQPGKGNSQPPR